jgi:hypothetical protein
MASLCISEFLGNGSGGSLERTLDQEVRRAVGVFLYLQELLEVRRSSSAAAPICLAGVVRDKLAVLAMDPAAAGVEIEARLPDTLLCRGNLKVLDRALDFLLATLRAAVFPGGAIDISARALEQWIELRLVVPSKQGEQLAAQLLSDTRPFDTKNFDFQNRKLPEVASVQQSLEALHGDLRIEGTNVALAFVVAVRHPHPPPDCCI